MADFYVAPAADGGNNANPGTYGSPKATVGGAHSAASAGDTIICKASSNVHSWGSVTFTKNLTVTGETTEPNDAILDAATAAVKWLIASSNITIYKKYLTFKNGRMDTREGIFAIQNNLAACNNSAWYAEDCVVHDIIASANDWGCGIWTQGYQASSGCILDVRKCLLYNLSRSASGNKIRVVGSYNSTGIIVNFYRNIVVSKVGITYPLSGMFSSSAENGTLNYYNNILVDYAAGSIPSTGTGTFATINKGHNGFYGFADDGGTGSLTSDPLFVDPANDNYNLQVDSPYIGAGVTP